MIRRGALLWLTLVVLVQAALVVGRSLPGETLIVTQNDPRQIVYLEPGSGRSRAFAHDALHPIPAPHGRWFASDVPVILGGAHMVIHGATTSRWLTFADFAAPGNFLARPAWSPDGRQLAYEVRSGGASSLHLMTVSGEQQQLTDRLGYLNVHGWTPDGVLLYEGENEELFAVRDGEVRLLWRAEHSSAVLSTNLIAYRAFVRTDRGERTCLYVGDLDTGLRRQRHCGPVLAFFQMAVAPDGSGLAFTAPHTNARDDYAQDIYLMDLHRTADPARLTHQPGHYNHLAWSPDGAHLAYAFQDQVFITDPADHTPQVVAAGKVTGVHWLR